MEQLLLIFAGLASGFGLIVLVLVLVIAIVWARRDARTGRSLLADPSRDVHESSIPGADGGTSLFDAPSGTGF